MSVLPHPALYPHCPIRLVLARISGKWPMLILRVLDEGQPLRFGELRHEIGDASPKMLTQSLRTLEEDGIVWRKVYPAVPARVEYGLTPRGEELFSRCRPLMEWAEENMEDILRERMAHVNHA